MRFVLLAIVAATAFGIFKTWNTKTSQDLRTWAFNTVFDNNSSRQLLRRVGQTFPPRWPDDSDSFSTNASMSTWYTSESTPSANLLPTNPMPPHQVQQVPPRRRLFQRRPGILIPLDSP